MSEIQLLEDDNAGSELEKNNDSSEDDQTRVSLRKKELQVFVIRTVHQTVQQVLEQNIVPLISKVVKLEIEKAGAKLLTSLKQNSGSGIHSVESRSYQLKFLNKLSLPVLTGRQIKGEGCTPIKVALVDSITEQVVNSGPEASAKVEVVAVEGDFDGDIRNNWTLEDFNNKIIREKEGRKSLLTGNVYLNLKEGIGFVGEISFTHNSNWMKICKLRLGAKVVDHLNGTRVREALTDSFVVKDRRSTLYGKHYPPSLNDEVWRLEKIGKDGPFHDRLRGTNINTVEDFLTQCFINSQRLQDILGTSMTAKMWEATVNHARTCIPDKKLNVYFRISSQKKIGVVFNVVGQVMGQLSECSYIPFDKLSEAEKVDAHKWVESAFKEHVGEVKSFDDETSMHASLQLLNAARPSNSYGVENTAGCHFEASHTDDGHDHTQPSTSSYANEILSFDEASLMHTSLQLLNAAHPSNSHGLENPGGCYFKASHTTDGHDHTQASTSSHANEVVSFDDEASFVHAALHLSTAACASDSLGLENPNSWNFETSHFNDEYVQPSTSYLGMSSFVPSFGSASNLNEYGFHSVEESTTQIFCEDEHLQSFDTDHSLQYHKSNLESQGDLHSIFNGFLLARAAVKAQRSWTVSCGVLRWYSRAKIAAMKFVSSESIHATKKQRIC